MSISFQETFLGNVPTENHCLQHRINTASLTEIVMAAPEKLRKYPGHPEGPVCVSDCSLICGPPFLASCDWLDLTLLVKKGKKKKQVQTVVKNIKGMMKDKSFVREERKLLLALVLSLIQ